MENGQVFVGVKSLQAKPMTRGDYVALRGWELPADENASDEGYFVEYEDGYISWSPASQFEAAYVFVGDSEYKPEAITERARSVVSDMAYSHRNLVSAQPDYSWRERELRNECLRTAAGVIASGTTANSDTVSLAREFHDFVTEEQPKAE